MDAIRVLIAEDEAAVRGALADLVGSAPDMEVVGAAADADEAIAMALDTLPDVALLDVKMPSGGGPRAAKVIRRESPGTRVVALSAYDDRSTVVDMLRAGVAGYVVKGVPGGEIVDAIRRAVRGQGVLSVEVTADVIHELVAHLERSERLADELRELDRVKSELIQVLAHELFTPLTTIHGFALTVGERGDQLSPEDFRDLAGGVERASGRLKRLVGNLRAAAQLDREGVEITTRPSKPVELIERAVSDFGAEPRIRVDRGADTNANGVWADAELASHAIAIVLENALDLSPPDAPVDVGARVVSPTDLEVTIADRGPGLSEEARERAFDAFWQAEDSMTRSHEGLGIGLFLAKRIMRALGGDVSVEAREGGGSVFCLRFAALGSEQP